VFTWHTIGKLATKVVTLFETAPQLEVFIISYGPPKFQKSQFQEFRDSLGVRGQNVGYKVIVVFVIIFGMCSREGVYEKTQFAQIIIHDIDMIGASAVEFCAKVEDMGV
jgi:hypothetical protein